MNEPENNEYKSGNAVVRWASDSRTTDETRAAKVAANYHARLPKIIAFMKPELEEFYGELTDEQIESSLGPATIDLDRGEVTYVEQTLDNTHIFIFEFWHDDFQELHYFSIDG